MPTAEALPTCSVPWSTRVLSVLLPLPLPPPPPLAVLATDAFEFPAVGGAAPLAGALLPLLLLLPPPVLLEEGGPEKLCTPNCAAMLATWLRALPSPVLPSPLLETQELELEVEMLVLLLLVLAEEPLLLLLLVELLKAVAEALPPPEAEAEEYDKEEPDPVVEEEEADAVADEDDWGLELLPVTSPNCQPCTMVDVCWPFQICRGVCGAAFAGWGGSRVSGGRAQLRGCGAACRGSLL